MSEGPPVPTQAQLAQEPLVDQQREGFLYNPNQAMEYYLKFVKVCVCVCVCVCVWHYDSAWCRQRKGSGTGDTTTMQWSSLEEVS